MNDEHPLQPRHPIRVVSQRTALSTEVLRAWERRYRVVTPGRTETGQRLYSDADIERLRLLRQATQQGRSISHVAELSTEELLQLVQEDEAERTRPSEARSHVPTQPSLAAQHLQGAEAAVRELNGPRLEAMLMRALVTLGADTFLDEVAVPLMRFLGSRWADGTLGVAHEHLASAVLRRVLGFIADSSEAPADAPALVAATPARQVHEFGALLAAATAGALGWRVVYLGADLPARDIASAARLAGAQVIALSMVFQTGDPELADELRRVRQGVGREVEILVGGAAASAHEALLDEIDARLLGDLSELRAALRELASGARDGHSPSGSPRRDGSRPAAPAV